MTAGMWYRVMVESNITHQVTNAGTALTPCKIETKYPQVEWTRTWTLAATPGLSSNQLTFIWRMVHDLLPTQARLHRLGMPNINSSICSLCNKNMVGNLTHSLLLCPFNDGAGHYLIEKLSSYILQLTPEQVILLNFDVSQEHQLPVLFMITSILSEIWDCRKAKKPCHLLSIRAALEAGINNLMKSRYSKSASTLDSILT